MVVLRNSRCSRLWPFDIPEGCAAAMAPSGIRSDKRSHEFSIHPIGKRAIRRLSLKHTYDGLLPYMRNSCPEPLYRRCEDGREAANHLLQRARVRARRAPRELCYGSRSFTTSLKHLKRCCCLKSVMTHSTHLNSQLLSSPYTRNMPISPNSFLLHMALQSPNLP